MDTRSLIRVPGPEISGPEPASNPTLATVARSAGVSVPTVSKVINGREDVALQTRRRVEDAVRQLGYVHRRRSDSRLPRLVDLVMPRLDHGRSPVVLHAAESAVHAAGLDIVVSFAHHHGRHTRLRTGSLDKLHARGTAGVLLDSTDLSGSQQAWLTRHRIPYVLLDPVSGPLAGVPTVSAAERAGAANAVTYLDSAGHDRIAVITGVAGTRRSMSHVAGYRSALRLAGLDAPPDYTRFADFAPERAEAEMLALLNLPDPPTAVLICSSSMVIGACRALQTRGLSIPDDMSIVAFEDLPITDWMMPQIPAIQVPIAEMVAEATRMLVQMIGGAAVACSHVEFPTRLVVRQSGAAW